MFPGGTRVSGLQASRRRQTAPVTRKTDKYNKRETDKCDINVKPTNAILLLFFFFTVKGGMSSMKGNFTVRR